MAVVRPELSPTEITWVLEQCKAAKPTALEHRRAISELTRHHKLAMDMQAREVAHTKQIRAEAAERYVARGFDL